MPPALLWDNLDWRPGAANGAPLIGGALGWLEGRLDAEHEVGDHTLFVGEVVNVEQGEPARASSTASTSTTPSDRKTLCFPGVWSTVRMSTEGAS